MVEILRLIDDPRLLLGVCEVAGGTVRASSAALRAAADALAARMAAPDWELPEDKRRSVRQMMKIGGFSATGRNRPAHELLINDLKERGEFHYINNVVDANNVVSLEALLPISVFDVAQLGARLTVRLGREGEGYVFNPSGQWLDVKRCIVCCRQAAGPSGSDLAPDAEPESVRVVIGDSDAMQAVAVEPAVDPATPVQEAGTQAGPIMAEDGEPIGTPVKDSMATKIFEGATGYLGVIYAASDGWTSDELLRHTERFADLLAGETGGTILRVDVL